MRYALFDIETRVDKELLNRVFFAGQELGDEEAYARFRWDLLARQGDDFPPLILHVPISVALGDVGADHVLRKVESLALDNYSEAELVREFWRRLEHFTGCLVSFNGRQFDLPVLELQALRHGLSCPAHFSGSGRRMRYAVERHLDLHDFLSNFGVFRLRGGMNGLLRMIGMPGKGTMDGSSVQQAYEAGRMDEIHRYCRRDVVQTYFLFLRVQLLRGEINQERYRAAAQASSPFLEAPHQGELHALASDPAATGAPQESARSEPAGACADHSGAAIPGGAPSGPSSGSAAQGKPAGACAAHPDPAAKD